MRLIDADALLAECKEAQKSDPNADGRGWANHFLNSGLEPSTEWYCVEDMIEYAPTVDAEPVVRCGKCKYMHRSQLEKWCWNEDSICYAKKVTDNWYCADAERKEDAT